MAQPQAQAPQEIQVRVTQQYFPPYDPLHGTPSPMVRRWIVFELPQGTANWEQSDYGHPGHFNPAQPRGIPPSLVAKTQQLQAAAEAIARLLD